MEQNWLIHDGSGSVWCGTGCKLVVLGQNNSVLLRIKWYWVDLGFNACIVYILKKSEDLFRCYHSGKNNQTRKDRATQPLHCIGPWKAEISKKGERLQRAG